MAIKTGVIGFGLAGRVFHAPYVHAVHGLNLAGIVQRNGDTAAQAYPAAQIFRSPEDLFASDIELVVVATPNQTHVPLTRAALLAGKHVVVDKPMTSTSAEAEKLQDLATRQGVLLAPFHNRRFDGDFLTVQRLIHEGKVGRPVRLLSRFDRFRPMQRPNSWKEIGGAEHGLVMDLGPHLIDQALVLFGNPTSIAANARTDRDQSEIDDAFDIVLQFEHAGRSIRVELGSTMLAAQPQPRFLLQGTAGSYQKYGVDPQEPSVLAGAAVPTQDSGDRWFLEPEAHWGTLSTAPNPDEPSTLVAQPVPTERGDYRRFYAGIADAIAHGATPPTTPRDAIRVARLTEMARESSQSGRTLSIPADF